MNHCNNENNLPSTTYGYLLSVACYKEDDISLQETRLQSLSLADAATCTHFLKNLHVHSFN